MNIFQLLKNNSTPPKSPKKDESHITEIVLKGPEHLQELVSLSEEEQYEADMNALMAKHEVVHYPIAGHYKIKNNAGEYLYYIHGNAFRYTNSSLEAASYANHRQAVERLRVAIEYMFEIGVTSKTPSLNDLNKELPG